MFKLQKIKIQSIVKGYHHYKIKPDIGVVCNVVREPNNKYDNFAMAVLNENGNIIGHVPATPVALNKVIFEALDLSSSFTCNW